MKTTKYFLFCFFVYHNMICIDFLSHLFVWGKLNCVRYDEEKQNFGVFSLGREMGFKENLEFVQQNSNFKSIVKLKVIDKS